MKRIVRDLVLAAAVGLSGSGCAYFADYQALPPAERQTYVNADLPVPAGFVLDRGASLRHERSSYRKLRLVFRRQEYLSEERTAEFVKNAFQQEGWELDFQYGLEEIKFIFHKGPEECRVAVKEDFGDRLTELFVEVEPRTTPDGAAVARAEWGTDPSQPPGPLNGKSRLEITTEVASSKKQ